MVSLKKIVIVFLILACYTFSGCLGGVKPTNDNPFDDKKHDNKQESSTQNTDVLLENVSSGVTVDYSDFDNDNSVDLSADGLVKISLDNANTQIEGDLSRSVEFLSQDNQYIIKITSGGVYVLSGKLTNGQIYVDAGENQVRLIFNGVDVSCCGSAPIYLNNGKKVVITLAEGSVNSLSDTNDYSMASSEKDEATSEVVYEPNGALFSKKSLTINGAGTLEIDGNFNNGLSCKDELKIVDATLRVEAVNNGIKGNDFVVLHNADVTVNSEGDGIKSSKENNALKGFVCIDGGNVKVVSGEDGIQAVTTVAIYNGSVSVDSYLKGIKSDYAMLLAGGTVNVTSSNDDTLHSNDFLDIVGGEIKLSAKDDGIHADKTITVKAGDISVTKSYEGIEATVINVEGGNISVVASDDGFNAANGMGGMGGPGGFPGGPGGMWPRSSVTYGASESSETTLSCEINISGGYVYVNAAGDGLDSNGNINISGGMTIVNGPTNNGNGALDSGDGGYEILVSGGTLIAAGSAGMAECPSSSSTQNILSINMNASENDLAIVDSNGKTIVIFEAIKQYQSVIISSPLLAQGQTYSLYSGDASSSGESSSGTLVEEFTISSIITTIGSGSGQGGMGGPGGGFPGGSGGRPGRW